jgi:hypothetical protein
MTTLTELLNNPEEHYPGNFDTPQRANALLTGLCQDAANEIERLNAEVLEQCRINGMSAEREDALRAELTRLKASIALDKMAENAREIGLDYEPAPVQEPYGYWWIPDGSVSGLKPAMSPNTGPHPNFTVIPLYTTPPAAQPAPVQEPRARLMTYIGKGPYPKPGYTVARTYEECPENQYPDAWEEGEKLYTTPPAAQPAAQEGRDWSLLDATQESLREHMAEIKRLKAAQPAPVQEKCFLCGERVDSCASDVCPKAPQPVPVKTYSGGKPWPVAPKPWVGLSEEEVYEAAHYCVKSGQSVNETIRAIETKLKGKNHG